MSTTDLNVLAHPDPFSPSSQNSRLSLFHTAASRNDIRLSTRRALARPNVDAMENSQQHTGSSTPSVFPEDASQIDIYRFAREHTSRSTLPAHSSRAQVQTTKTSSKPDNSSPHHQQGGSFIKTIRRVFSRSKQLGQTEPHPAQSSKPRSEDPEGNFRRAAEESLVVSTRTSAPVSSKASQDFHSTRNAFAQMQTSEHNNSQTQGSTSIKQGPTVTQSESPPRRLRKSRSTVYRITPLSSSNSTNQTISPAYYTPQPSSPRHRIPSIIKAPTPHLRPSPEFFAPPAPPDTPEHQPERSQSGASQSRDSLDLLRERYNSSKSEERQRKGSASSAADHRHQISSSSMSIGVGSVQSPPQPDFPLSGTAPRFAMEAAGISARLLDLEVRMDEVETSLSKLKFDDIEPTTFDDYEIAQNTAKNSPRAIPTPPSSLRRRKKNRDTFLHENSSTPQSSDEEDVPSTPTGDLVEIGLPKDPALQPDVTWRQNDEVLRGSLLDKGYHHTLHKVFRVVNAEHNARVALEADVHSLRDAILALRNDCSILRRPIPGADSETNWRPHTSHSTNPSGDMTADAMSIPDFPSPERRPLAYDDLWSHAAVPAQSRPSTGIRTSSQHHRALSADLPLPGGTPLVSKFSFDETNSSISGIRDEPSHDQDISELF